MVSLKSPHCIALVLFFFNGTILQGATEITYADFPTRGIDTSASAAAAVTIDKITSITVGQVGGNTRIFTSEGSGIVRNLIDYDDALTNISGGDVSGGAGTNALFSLSAGNDVLVFINNSGTDDEANFREVGQPDTAHANTPGSPAASWVAADSNGNVYTNAGAGNIDFFEASDYSDPRPSIIPVMPGGNAIQTLAADPTHLYIRSSASPSQLVKVDASDASITWVAPAYLEYNGSGDVYGVSNAVGGYIAVYSVHDGSGAEKAIRIFDKNKNPVAVINEALMQSLTGDNQPIDSIDAIAVDGETVYAGISQEFSYYLLKIVLESLTAVNSEEVIRAAIVQNVKKQTQMASRAVTTLTTKSIEQVAQRLTGVNLSLGFSGTSAPVTTGTGEKLFRQNRQLVSYKQLGVLASRAPQITGLDTITKLAADGHLPDITSTCEAGRRYSMWFSGSYDYGRNAKTEDTDASEDRTASLSIGFESENKQKSHMVGFAVTAGGAHSTIDNSDTDKTKIKFWQLSAYNAWNIHPKVRWSQIISGGKAYVDSDRGENSSVVANSTYALSNITMGTHLSYLAFITPAIGLNWWHSRRPSYQETGSSASLQRFESTKASGLNLMTSLSCGRKIKWRTYDVGFGVNIGYTYALRNPKRTENAYVGTTFASVELPQDERHKYNAGLNVSIGRDEKWSIDTKITGEIERNRRNIGGEIKLAKFF